MKLKLENSEEGSVLLFGIGLGIVALIILTTAINIASLWVTRTKLDSVADATALAASRSIDVENFYQVGLKQPIKLNESLARVKATNFLNRLSIHNELNEFRLVELHVEQESVEVVIAAKADLPFGYLTYGLDSTVLSRAKVSIRTH